VEHTWEQQREQLSALLDNELEEQERAELEAHLPTCAECRAELESLRRAKALVRAMPLPALPRSFALPLDAASIPEQPLQAAAARPTPGSARPLPGGTKARRSNRRPSVRTLQWISTIAAVLGIVLFLSGVFSNLSFSHGATTSALSSNAPAAAGTGQSSGTITPSPSTERTPSDTQSGDKTPAPTSGRSAPTPTDGGQQPGVQHTPVSSADSAGALISATGLGGLLLIFSACGFALAWALRRRW
jgi:anti-sigma factor RsiW